MLADRADPAMPPDENPYVAPSSALTPEPFAPGAVPFESWPPAALQRRTSFRIAGILGLAITALYLVFLVSAVVYDLGRGGITAEFWSSPTQRRGWTFLLAVSAFDVFLALLSWGLLRLRPWARRVVIGLTTWALIVSVGYVGLIVFIAMRSRGTIQLSVQIGAAVLFFGSQSWLLNLFLSRPGAVAFTQSVVPMPTQDRNSRPGCSAVLDGIGIVVAAVVSCSVLTLLVIALLRLARWDHLD